MSTAFRPLNDRVLLRRVTAEKTPGGLFIPQTSQKPTEAEVVAVGPGRLLDSGKFVETTVKVGNRVLYPAKNYGVEVNLDGEDYLVMSEQELLGVIG